MAAFSLLELEAEFVAAHGHDGLRRLGPDAGSAQGILFLCPGCFARNGGSAGTHSILVWFRDRGVPEHCEPKPRWVLTGSGLADLSLHPSINLDVPLSPAQQVERAALEAAGHPQCCWHGWIRGGYART